MTIHDELDALSQAHGPKALLAAFGRIRAAITTQRRQAHATLGSLAASFRAAMEIWETQKAEGVSEADRVTGLEQTLRSAWPQTREWHYYCDGCQDTGWESRICRTAGQCGRPFKLPGQRGDDWTGRGKCTPDHSYVVPCTCLKGVPLRQHLLHVAGPADFTQAGKTKPTRIGR